MSFLRGKKEDTRALFHLAWPALAENVLSTMAQFVDTAMVGGLGAVATAAVAVNVTPMWLCNGLIAAVSVGGTALIARMVGANDREGAEAACRQVFISILALSTVICAALLLLAGKIPVWMRADAALHADASSYLRIIALGLIPHFTGVTLGAVLRGAGDTRTPMLVSFAANLSNLVGNFLLIFPSRTLTIGRLSFPMWGAGLGVQGAAISTAISTGVAGMYLLWIMCSKSTCLRLRLKGLKPDLAVLSRILRIGIPSAMERVTINVGQLMFVGMIASLGTAQLAAHHLSITVESLSYMPGFAFGIAATTLVGQSLGANKLQEAKSRGALSIQWGILVMSGIGVLLFVLAPVLISLLTPDETVRAIGAMLIRICAFEQPFMALNQTGAGALRGAGDTRVPFYISLAGMWGVRIGLAWLLAIHFKLGVNGAWYAMVVDLGVRSALVGIRFARGKWLMAKV